MPFGNIKLLNKFSIAMVGSRNASKYGMKNAENISKELSEFGITIISGLAIGIDYYSHIGAMQGIGKTIAVLGSGFGKIYPKENMDLFKYIIENDGCIISEYEFNSEVKPSNFAIRNRIISGMAVATLVVEARERSGSTITARYTLSENKKLFCIPNSINIKHGEGVNNLIRKGGILTRNVNDILEEFLFDSNIRKNEKWKEDRSVPEKYKEIYEILYEKLNIEEIFNKSSYTKISDINQILSMMEIDGYVEKLVGNYYIRKC